MSDAADLLDGVKGVGPATRDAVLARFPGLTALSNATVEELTEIKGVGPATARAIKQAVGGARSTPPTDDREPEGASRGPGASGTDDLSGRAQEVIHLVTGIVRTARDVAAEQLPRIADEVRERLPRLAEEVREQLPKVRDEVVRTGREVVDRAKQTRTRR